ncbi:M6 family metalloprotease domain-containing protein [Shewanella psychrophila]|uniref:M6 family metalloprotease domain-containing protein n=1 Tax=Shewanella psychrophila TaxID=225848 RepID=A0A1S6HYE1_9GAMM|nr:immune inhibitor A domain-containing protein [Shewanella psychrophila]AQS40597.1 M6 family metalloprotease domain-containing protein [Shewanella psychrophila]
MKRINNISRRSLISLSLSLILSVTASTSLLAKETDAKLESSPALSSGQFASTSWADAGVINREQIQYWLIKRGELAADASEADKRAAVDKFTLRATSFQSKGRLIEAQFEKARLKSLAQSKEFKRNSMAKMVGTLADADITKTVKVLGILIDFPDLPFDNNRLSASDTPMFYANYPVSHYNDLMFSTTGFTGPQGQNLLTGYQYYQAESGERFNFTGDIKGWFTAANNAAFYGGNDPDNNNDDKAVDVLVKEAVTLAVVGMSPSELASYDVEDPFDADGDGNFNESDGFIDHVMLFHSSIGEEAGGGVLGNNGADAIWSHSSSVSTGASPGYLIPGTGKKVFGYTIQPIDAAAGVVVHEFGHDLGLPDEYDTSNTGDGSPVGSWSVMSAGSWTGTIAGTEPTGFSPYARSYLQDRYKGRWINEQEILLSSIGASGLDVVINEAINHSLVNQVSIPLPSATIPFKQPYGGVYQYYSGQGHLINNALSFEIDLPISTPLTLTMKAHWNIEINYDYAQVMVDGVAISGNHTKASNTVNMARDIITGDSGIIFGAEGPNNWVDLEYDISAYAGRTNAQFSIVYKTDENAGNYGFVIDDLQIKSGASEIYSDDGETPNTMMLNGFSRIDGERPGAARRYIVQLRSHNGVDAGLDSHSYEPGVLMWLENFSYSDNNSNAHPGAGLIGVIDADQNLIGTKDSDTQVRDATFSMFNQSSYAGDNHLSSISMFDDSQDYSAPTQPQSGIILPELGLTMEVVAQSGDSSTATVRFNYGGATTPPPASDLASSFITSQEVAGTVVFSATVTGGDGNYSYLWGFGVTGATSAEEMPTYNYETSGSYTVSLTVTDGLGSSVVSSQTITVDLPVPPEASFTFSSSDLSVTFTDTTTGGEGAITYLWNFGDGQTSTAQSPSHTYASAGSYTVMMTVTDSLGVVSSQSTPVNVTATVVTPSGDSGGGSLGWLSLGLLALMGLRRRRY